MDNIKSELLQMLSNGQFFQAALRVSVIRDNAFCSEPYEARIAHVMRRLIGRGRRPRSVLAWIQRINKALFGGFGMTGGSARPRLVIDDPDRYFLDRVIDNRSGSPLALTVIYWYLADSVGLVCECLSLPSYYLLKLSNHRKEIYVDPFEGGRILTSEEFQKKFRSALLRHPATATNLFERITPTQLVARLIQQLKQIYVLKGNPLFALRAVELLTALFPDSPEFARDRGILYCEIEYFSKAATDLKFYLDHRPKADDMAEIKQLNRILRGYREIVN